MFLLLVLLTVSVVVVVKRKKIKEFIDKVRNKDKEVIVPEKSQADVNAKSEVVNHIDQDEVK